MSTERMGSQAYMRLTLGGLVVGAVSGLFPALMTLLLLVVALVVFVFRERKRPGVPRERIAALGFLQRYYYRSRYMGAVAGVIIGLVLSNMGELKKAKPTEGDPKEGAEKGEVVPEAVSSDGKVRINPNTGEVERSPAKAEPAPSYRIVDEEVSESQIKTQLTLKVVVPPNTDKEALHGIMKAVYKEASGRTGFKLRTHPSAIYAYFFTSEHNAKSSPTSHVGMVSKAHAESEPTYGNLLGSGSLVDQVYGALKVKKDSGPLTTRVVQGPKPGSISLTAFHRSFEKGKTVAAKRLDKSSLWFQFFYRAQKLFESVGELEELTIREIFKDKPVVEVTLSRSQWEIMNYGPKKERMMQQEAAIEERAVRSNMDMDKEEMLKEKLYFGFWRELLSSLPPSAKKIKKAARL